MSNRYFSAKKASCRSNREMAKRQTMTDTSAFKGKTGTAVKALAINMKTAKRIKGAGKALAGE